MATDKTTLQLAFSGYFTPNRKIMRISFLTLASTAAIALFAVGCAGPEQKLGRGIHNTFEIVRGGEMSRSIEQTTLFDATDAGYSTGAVRGFDRTLARTGLGVWEVVTFPFPNHDNSYAPLATQYLPANPAYPDNYTPGWLGGDTRMETDTQLGFSGGDVAPFVPGSRFSVFNN
jgi:putative exosortase-associated protein (TIGR04073 family)